MGCVSTIVILPNSTLPLLITETYKLDLGNEVKPVIRLADTVEVSSLEKTGSKLGHRYKKATRAKDISNATAKDMEGIFGRSSQSEKKAEEERIKQAEKEAEDLKTKPQFEESSKHVKQTETVHDYFKRKMAERAERLKLAAVKCEVKTENTEDDTPLPQLMNSEEVKEEHLGIKTERIEDHEEVTEEPKKKKKKKKSKPAEEVETEVLEEVPKKKKKRKVEEVTEERVEDIEESVPSEETPKKKKKKEKKEGVK